MFFSLETAVIKRIASLVAIADTADAPEAPAMQMATMTERIIVLELRQVAQTGALELEEGWIGLQSLNTHFFCC